MSEETYTQGYEIEFEIPTDWDDEKGEWFNGFVRHELDRIVQDVANWVGVEGRVRE